MNNSKLQFLSFVLLSSFICSAYTSSSSSNNTGGRCSLIQTHALLQFKQNLFSYNHSYDENDNSDYICQRLLGFDYYPIMMNWNMSIDCCNWNGVTCDHFTNDVIALDLSCGMLRGAIHPNSTLFNLPRLQRLNLAFNEFTGSQLPKEIGRFSNTLTHLNISDCGFMGQVPTDITILRKLVSIDLSGNYFKLEPQNFYNLLRNTMGLEELLLENIDISSILPTYLNISSSMKSLILGSTGLLGKLPNNIFNLPYLEELDLAFNINLTIRFPKVYTNTSIPLKWLDLSSTNLCGEIPNTISHLKSLNYLDLSDTNLSGEIPDSISHLKSLNYLDLSYTNLLGEIPYSIGNLKSLSHMLLSNTNLSGEIPDSIGNLKSLNYLDLSHTNLSGEIPNSISHLKSLNYLRLTNTNVLGEIPNSIDHLKSLNYLDLSHTNLSGVIPDSIGHLKSLNYLDLSNTNLLGELPDSIGRLKSLIHLDLSYTNLSREIPDSIGHLKSLNHLLLSNTNLLGEIPYSIGHLESLTYLDLSYTNFSGEIPDSIGHLKSLIHLDLSHTNLLGEIPDSIGHLESLTYLDLQSNLIQGSFPPSICNMRRLWYLDMSTNSFGGVIPECMSNISSTLRMVDFGNNRLHGTIPNAWDDCGGLEGLILNGNRLEGEVPSGLSKCESLKVLDLGNNHLNGTFPYWLGNLQHLQVLVLKSNKFHGPIEGSPIIKHPFSSLEVLDLSQNKFVGHLPKKYFQNFDAMKNVVKKGIKPEYLSIGKFYSITISVKGLELPFPKISVDYTIVDLSSNIFQGEIPNVIGSLNSLIVLNLSHNNLNGGIPNALGNLSEIESLDLSCNRLTGMIPQSLTDITTLEVLNLSQNLLVGRIPHGNQFNTFDENSFGGNLGLCGLPLPKPCEHLSTSQLEVDEDEENEFTWKVVMLGYGCGTILGLWMGYLMLSTGRPKWFTAIVDKGEHTIQMRRSKSRIVYIRK